MTRKQRGLPPLKRGCPKGATQETRTGLAMPSSKDDAMKLSLRTGDAIRVARVNAGVTQARLAAACGVRACTVSDWETLGNVSVWRLWQVARALGVPPTYLLGDDE